MHSKWWKWFLEFRSIEICLKNVSISTRKYFAGLEVSLADPVTHNRKNHHRQRWHFLGKKLETNQNRFRIFCRLSVYFRISKCAEILTIENMSKNLKTCFDDFLYLIWIQIFYLKQNFPAYVDLGFTVDVANLWRGLDYTTLQILKIIYNLYSCENYKNLKIRMDQSFSLLSLWIYWSTLVDQADISRFSLRQITYMIRIISQKFQEHMDQDAKNFWITINVYPDLLMTISRFLDFFEMILYFTQTIILKPYVHNCLELQDIVKLHFRHWCDIVY